VEAAAAFCQKCGERQAGRSAASAAGPAANAPNEPAQASAPPGSSVAGPGAASGLQENVAAALCYALFWVSGIVFLVIDKRPYVQFHAAQSLVLFGGLYLLRAVVRLSFGLGLGLRAWMHADDWDFSWPRVGVAAVLLGLISLTTFVLWILMMLKAYQGERFRVPIAADLAENITGK
jgi:uncharacterized membrane protein